MGRSAPPRSCSAAAPAGVRAQQADDAAMAAMQMQGLYGSYSMTREGSGTSWQPDTTPMQGAHQMQGDWLTMEHGFIDAIYDDQGGPRGATQSFSTSMLMFMARRELTDGAFGVRLMVSADPLMGKSGYPLLFQTGETANGIDPLIDRQHPHDLLMEAALTYSHDFGAGSFGLRVRRPSRASRRWVPTPSCTACPRWKIRRPRCRITGSTRPTSPGVSLTAGYVVAGVKLEASAFNGREPDQNRYDIEVRALDSYAVRASYNPSERWSLQASFGRLASPEQLEPAGERAPQHRLGELQRPGGALVADHARLRPQHALCRRGHGCLAAGILRRRVACADAVRALRARGQGRAVPSGPAALRPHLHHPEALARRRLRLRSAGPGCALALARW